MWRTRNRVSSALVLVVFVLSSPLGPSKTFASHDFSSESSEGHSGEWRPLKTPLADEVLDPALDEVQLKLKDQGYTMEDNSPITILKIRKQESESDVLHYLLEFLLEKHRCMLEASEQLYDHDEAEESSDEGHHSSDEEEAPGGEEKSEDVSEESEDDREAGHRPGCRRGQGIRLGNGKGRHRGRGCQNRRGKGRGMIGRRGGFQTGRRKFCPRKCKAVVEVTGVVISVTRLWCKGRKEKEIIPQRAPCLGCPLPLSLKHPHVHWVALKAVHEYNILREISNSFDIYKITSATRQVVHGILYHVEFTAIETNCSYEDLEHSHSWESFLHPPSSLMLPSHTHHEGERPNVPPHPPNPQHEPHHSAEAPIKDKDGELRETPDLTGEVDQEKTSCPPFPPETAQVLTCIGTVLLLPSETSVTVCCDLIPPTIQGHPSLRGIPGLGPFRAPFGPLPTLMYGPSPSLEPLRTGKTVDDLSCNREVMPPPMGPEPDNPSTIHEEATATSWTSMGTFSDEDLLG
uniref:uncharacterized protein n=1 Tax=Myxine glutinosa TaxID=7769 RepID=UPI00358FBD96